MITWMKFKWISKDRRRGKLKRKIPPMVSIPITDFCQETKVFVRVLFFFMLKTEK